MGSVGKHSCLRRTRIEDELSIYARAQVRHSWLVNPDQRLLEVLRCGPDGWLRVAAHRDDARVRAEPFDAIELDLSVLWVDAEA